MEGIEKFTLSGKEFSWASVPVGNVNLVLAQGKKGVVGCGAVDVIALEKFSLPAVKVKPTKSDSIRDLDDLLTGEVVVVNSFAKEMGITSKMSGKEALLVLE